ncbi:MAG: GT4 family glycosyltransferase PelF, partial [Gammaproteobacteria bacterium]|nr:GT4 family glycosyltransferase PelF [Gammaproteobacteria bacterium]
MSLKTEQSPADVCMILEGSYPYVAGGVSSWAHDLIKMQPHLTFHLLVLVARGSELKLRYELPDNIVGITEVVLQSPPLGKVTFFRQRRIIQQVEEPLDALFRGGGLKEIRKLLGVFSDNKGRISRHLLLDSKEAWEMSLRFYKKDFAHCSFLDFFWAWRGILSGLYSVLQGSLPQAKMYHAISTGYAGLYMARAKIETGRPTVLTEHGIYTNERRIEIAMADWLHE